jgi:hypothetical protein
MKAAFIYTLSVIFDVLIFGATGYLVFWNNQSGWWFLLAIFISWGNTTAAYKILGVKKETE